MRIILVLNKAYAQDPRAQRQITALSDQGHLLDVLCFKDPLYPEPALAGVTFHSLPLYRRRQGRVRYAVEFAVYLVYCLFQCFWLLCRRRNTVLQISVLPEVMILLKVVAGLFGIRVVTDWMDLGYELYQTKLGLRRFDPYPWLIHQFERLIVRWSDLVLVPNNAFLRALATRGIAAKNALVIMNSADEKLFKPKVGFRPQAGPLHLIYNGTINYRNGADLAYAAAARALEDCGGIRLTIVGEAREFEALTEFTHVEQVEGLAVFTGRIELSEVVKRIASSDIGLITTRDTALTRINVPTRIYEFGVMGKPIICADLDGIREYFDDSCVLFHRPGDVADVARCIRELRDNSFKAQKLAANLQRRCQSFSWNTMKQRYCAAMETGTAAVPQIPGETRGVSPFGDRIRL